MLTGEEDERSPDEEAGEGAQQDAEGGGGNRPQRAAGTPQGLSGQVLLPRPTQHAAAHPGTAQLVLKITNFICSGWGGKNSQNIFIYKVIFVPP